MKNDTVIEYIAMLLNFIEIIIGSNKVISTSKIKKIIAIKKKCIENGNRDDDLGSNPHSNGDLFSRSVVVFFAVMFRIIISIILIIVITVAISIRDIITYTISRSFDWKSKIIFILCKLSTSSVDRNIQE